MMHIEGGFMPKNKNNRQKLIAILIASVLFSTAAYAQVFTNSEGGIAVDALPKSEFSGLDFNVRGGFESQIQLGNSVLLETEFSFRTNNLFDNIFIEEVPSTFTLDKLSLSYSISGLDFTTRVTGFTGTYDVVGSDDYIQKYFGTQPFDSVIFEKSIAMQQAGIITIDGYGVEISTLFDSGLSAGLYGYYNDKIDEDSMEEVRNLNFDVRFATVTDSVILDFIFGTSLPFENKDSSGDNVVVLIRRADVHAGLNLLLGSSPHANVLLQAGVTRIQTKPPTGEDVFSLKNLHIFLEPRFAVNNVETSLSLFMMPQSTVNLIEHIEYSTGGGLNINVITNLGRVQSHFGAHVTASYDTTDDFAFNLDRFSLLANPYAEFKIGSGELKISAPIKPLNYDQAENMFNLSVAYKTTF